MTRFPLRGKCRRQYVQANWIFRSVATRKSSETPFRAQRDGACQRPSNNAQYTVVLPPQPSGQLPRWGAKNDLPLNLIALPSGEGGPRQQWIGYYRYPCTCEASHGFLHSTSMPPVPYPPRFARHLPLEGKAILKAGRCLLLIISHLENGLGF